MAWDVEFEKMMNQMVTVKPWLSVNSYSENTYGAGVARKCYIDFEPHQVVDQSGDTITANAAIYFAGPIPIAIRDVVILPGEAPRERPLISCNTRYDEEGPHHSEAHV